MPGYKDLYFCLFTAMSQAIDAMDAMDFGRARAVLVAAQQQTEELYMQGLEEERELSQND